MPAKTKPSDAQKSVQELLAKRRQHKEELEKVDQHLGNRLEEAFESVWTGTLKPILDNLQDTAAGVLEEFSDFEEEFRNYMKVREPDVNVDLLEDILHDPKTTRTKKARPRKTRTAEEKARILKKYEQAKDIGLGSVYLNSEGIKSVSQIAKWKTEEDVKKRLSA